MRTPLLLAAASALAASATPAIAQTMSYDEVVYRQGAPVGYDVPPATYDPAARYPAERAIGYPAPYPQQDYPGYDAPDYYRDSEYYAGDYYADASYDDLAEQCRRDLRRDREDGGTGAVIGGVVGGVAGNRIAGRGSRLGGTLVGAGLGALAGYGVDRAISEGNIREDCERLLAYEGEPYTDAGPGYAYADGGYGRADYGYHQGPMPARRSYGHMAYPGPIMPYGYGYTYVTVPVWIPVERRLVEREVVVEEVVETTPAVRHPRKRTIHRQPAPAPQGDKRLRYRK